MLFRSERVSPLRFSPAKGAGRGFDLLFPRRVVGKAVLDPPDGTLRVEFPHPRIAQVQEGRVLVEFKGSKLLVDGQPSY